MVLALFWMFCTDLRTDSDFSFIHHKLIGFYNRGGKCLQRGTDWFLIEIRLLLVFKRSMHMLWLCLTENVAFSSIELQKSGWIPLNYLNIWLVMSCSTFRIFFFLTFSLLIGWQLSIWKCRKPFFSLLYNCQLLFYWRLALSIAVEVFLRPVFRILLLQGCSTT